MVDHCAVLIESVPCGREVRSSKSPYCAPHYRQNLAGKPFAALKIRRPKGSTSTRNSNGEKQCGKCSGWFDESRFRGGQKTSDGLHGFCLDCERAGARASYYRAGGYKPEMGIFRKFKLRESEYQRILQDQDGCCAACGESVEERLHVDHDHSCCNGSTTCGKCTRGLLCRKCNLALGLLDDNLERISALFDYLKGWKNGQ